MDDYCNYADIDDVSNDDADNAADAYDSGASADNTDDDQHCSRSAKGFKLPDKLSLWPPSLLTTSTVSLTDLWSKSAIDDQSFAWFAIHD